MTSSVNSPGPGQRTSRKPTYFATPAYIYVSPLPDGSIPTKEFIDASRGIVNFIAMFGTAFSPIKNDIAGNINKLESVYRKDKERNKTVQKLVKNELESAKDGKMGYATEGLLWLKRALEFMRVLLELLVSDHISGAKSENLVAIFRHSYETTLKKHHNFIARKLFGLMIHAVPWRRDLLKAVSLGHDVTEEHCIEDLQNYMPTYCANVDALVKFYTELKLEEASSPGGLDATSVQ